MAEQLYFVRKRGEVSGPFSVAQLRSLHARGLFARFNEVSLDGAHWVPASSIQELFPAAPGQTVSEVAAPAPATGHGLPLTRLEPPPETPLPATVCEPVADSIAGWYYLDRHGAQQGPYTLYDLQQLLDSGQVDPSTYASRPGMAQWVELKSLPGLHFRQARAKGSRGWLLLAVIAVPLVGMGLVALLTYLAIQGFQNDDQGTEVLNAFLALVVFLLVVVATVLLAVLYRRQTSPSKAGRKGGQIP
jgi:hypothetical protein